MMPQATSVARGRKEGKGSPGEEQQSSAAGEVGRGHWNGDLFVDGSGYEPTMPEIRRAGWSVACGKVIEEGGELKMVLEKGLFGCLVARQSEQTVPRAEHQAFRECLEIVIGAEHLNQKGKCVNVYTDCQLVFDSYHLGRDHNHKGTFADFWRFWWRDLAKLRCKFRVYKVKAHQVIASLKEGSAEWYQASGNDLADQWAKEGAKRHRVPEAIRSDYEGQRKQNLDAIRFIVAALVTILEKGSWEDKEDMLLEIATREREAAKAPTLKIVEHDFVTIHGQTRCRTCLRWARTRGHTERLEQDRCQGCPSHASHKLRILPRSGARWCLRCGAFADKLGRALVGKCSFTPTRWGKSVLRAVARGRHPATGLDLK